MSVESDNERESRQQQQQRVFTHEVDIQIKAEDLDNIFDDEDEDFMSADVCMVSGSTLENWWSFHGFKKCLFKFKVLKLVFPNKINKANIMTPSLDL